MNSAYETVKRSATLEAMHEKASIIQDVERFWLPVLTKRFSSINLDELFPSWLHLLTPTSLDDQAESQERGSSGGPGQGGVYANPEMAAQQRRLYDASASVRLAMRLGTGGLLGAADGPSQQQPSERHVESCEDVPSQEAVLEQWDDILRDDLSTVYKKTAQIHAIETVENGALTILEGSTEIKKNYEKGDYIVCGSEGDRYTMRALDFAVRYDRNRPRPASNPALANEARCLSLRTCPPPAPPLRLRLLHSRLAF